MTLRNLKIGVLLGTLTGKETHREVIKLPGPQSACDLWASSSRPNNRTQEAEATEVLWTTDRALLAVGVYYSPSGMSTPAALSQAGAMTAVAGPHPKYFPSTGKD